MGAVEVVDVAQIAHAQVQQGCLINRPVVVKADIVLIRLVVVGDVRPCLGIDQVMVRCDPAAVDAVIVGDLVIDPWLHPLEAVSGRVRQEEFLEEEP